MNRRSLLKLGGLFAVTLPALAFQEEKSKLKITGVRLVRHPAQTSCAQLHACSGIMVDARRRGSKPHVDLPAVQGDAVVVES